MAADELVDMRARITELTHQVIDAKARVSGKQHAEIIRDVLHQWAIEEVRMADMIQRLTRSSKGSDAARKGD